MSKLEEAFQEHFARNKWGAELDARLRFDAGAVAMAEIQSGSAPMSRVERMVYALMASQFKTYPAQDWAAVVLNTAIEVDRLLSVHEKLHP